MAKDFKVILGQLNGIINKIQTKELHKEIAQSAVDTVWSRVKDGYGVTSDKIATPTEQKLAPLSQNYIDVRKGKSKWFTNKYSGTPYKVVGSFGSPVSGVFGSPTKSNLTLTGQMLDALTYKITNNGFIVYIKGKLNQEKATWASEGRTSPNKRPPRPFMAFTIKEQKLLAVEYLNAIRKIIRSVGLTLRG